MQKITLGSTVMIDVPTGDGNYTQSQATVDKIVPRRFDTLVTLRLADGREIEYPTSLHPAMHQTSPSICLN